MSGYPLIGSVATPEQVAAVLPEGTSIRRFAQISNATNSTAVTAATNTMLPLNNDGTQVLNYNNPAGKCSVDTANDWIDVTDCSQHSGLEARVTFKNAAGRKVTGQVIMRLIPNKATPTVGVIDILTDEITFSTTSSVLMTSYKGTAHAVRFGIRTTSDEAIELKGVYMNVWDVL